MAKDNNTILWIIGIAIFLIVVTSLPTTPWFAIITKTTCIDNTVSDWDFDENVLDSLNLNDGINFNAKFIPGKIGQAIEFNTTNYIDFPAVEANVTVMWIKDYSIGDTDYSFVADINGTNYVNGALDNTKQIIPIGPGFGLGFNGSVDMAATFSDLSMETMLDIYNNGSARSICYTTSYEENVTCKDYATEQVTPATTGCLNYSGTFFPNCDYTWETTTGFYVVGSVCEKRFYCEDILGTDFSSQTLCEDSLIIAEEPTISVPYTAPPETFKDKLSKEIFEVAGFKVTLVHLGIVVLLILGYLYFTKKK